MAKAWVKTRRGSVLAGLAAVGVAVLAGLSVPGAGSTSSAVLAQDASAEVFTVDSVHSMVMFRIKHLGVAFNYGMFHEPEGAFLIDVDEPSASSVDIRIQAGKLDTGNESRDNHLKSGDFFDVRRHPEIRFVATSFESVDDDTVRATGDLTMLGETREVSAELTKTGEGQTPRGYKAGFEGTFTINRSDWGMDKYVAEGALGDEVMLMVTMEGDRE